MRCPRLTSCCAVRRCTLPISFRYRRTGSSAGPAAGLSASAESAGVSSRTTVFSSSSRSTPDGSASILGSVVLRSLVFDRADGAVEWLISIVVDSPVSLNVMAVFLLGPFDAYEGRTVAGLANQQ